jgi:hypothetical protein
MSTATAVSGSAFLALNQIIGGPRLCQALGVAAELGVADCVKDEPLSAAEIAARTGANGEKLYRVLRALATVGVFREDETGRFAQTEISQLLRSDVAGSQRAWARMTCAKWHWDMLGWMTEAVRTGRNFTWEGWKYFEQNPAEAQVFNQAMTSFSASEIGPVLEAYDFAGISLLMEAGGGHGALLRAILGAHAGMRGILFDLPSVIGQAREHMAGSRVADRCELVGGSFLESVPPGADAILMKHVIHDWNDEDSLRILKNCHAALPEGGKLLVVEAVITPGNEPSVGKMLDLIMLVAGGQERTEAQFRALLAAAGFEMTRTVPTKSPVSVIEARKV